MLYLCSIKFKKYTTMATAVKTQAFGSTRTQTKQQPQSTIMLWREKNPEGLGGKFTNMDVVLR